MLHGLWPGRTTTLIVVIFLALNLVIIALSDSGCREVGADCHRESDRYGVFPADALLEYGSFVDPREPTEMWTKWPPGYPIMVAGLRLVLGQGSSLFPLITVNLIFLLAIGWMAKLTLSTYEPRFGDLALALVLFNPNLLAFAHLVSAEMLQAFLIALCFFLTLCYAERPGRVWIPPVCGLLVACATLTRPSSQFLLLLFPIALPLIVIAAGNAWAWRRALVGGILATAVAIGTVTPWLQRQIETGEGLTFVSRHTQHLYILDNLQFLSPERPGEAVPAYKKQLWEMEERQLDQQHPGWRELDFREETRLRLEILDRYLDEFSINASAVIIAFVKSIGRYVLGGGEGYIHRLFGMEYQPEKSALAFYGIKVGALAFSGSVRLLGLFGVLYLILQRQYALVLLSVGLAAYFAAPHPFFSHPRYRVPAELPLMLLAAFGALWISNLVARRRLSRAVE